MLNNLGITLLAIFCVQSAVFSIEEDSLKRKTEIGFAIGVDYCFRTLAVDEPEYSTAEYYEFLRELGGETWKLGNRFQVDIVQPLSKRFNLITGLKYMDRGYMRRNTSWMDENLIYMSGRARVNFKMTYLSVPLKIEMNQHFNKWSLFLNAGVGFEYMIRNSYRARVEHTSSAGQLTTYWYQRTERLVPWYPNSWEEDHNRLMFSGLGEFGAGFQVSERAKLRISSTANYSLTSVFKAPIDERLWSIGLKLGMTFEL